MADLPSIDLSVVAQFVKLPLGQVEAAVGLLDQENSIPFIARYKRDETKGLNEPQLRRIREQVQRARALAERKAIIRKSIKSQDALSEEIDKKIESARTSRELEDVYLPFKPQKQTQAELARQKGLEPLAKDLFEATVTVEDLPARVEQFVRVDKGLNSIDDVYDGVHHLLVEMFNQNVDVRQKLRESFRNEGFLVVTGSASTAGKTPKQEKAASPEQQSGHSNQETAEAQADATADSQEKKQPSQDSGDTPPPESWHGLPANWKTSTCHSNLRNKHRLNSHDKKAWNHSLKTCSKRRLQSKTYPLVSSNSYALTKG